MVNIFNGIGYIDHYHTINLGFCPMPVCGISAHSPVTDPWSFRPASGIGIIDRTIIYHPVLPEKAALPGANSGVQRQE